MSCLPKHDILSIYLVEDGAEFMKGVAIFALSYRFPTSTKIQIQIFMHVA